jgi:hypothetical protein
VKNWYKFIYTPGLIKCSYCDWLTHDTSMTTDIRGYYKALPRGTSHASLRCCLQRKYNTWISLLMLLFLYNFILLIHTNIRAVWWKYFDCKYFYELISWSFSHALHMLTSYYIWCLVPRLWSATITWSDYSSYSSKMSYIWIVVRFYQKVVLYTLQKVSKFNKVVLLIIKTPHYFHVKQ